MKKILVIMALVVVAPFAWAQVSETTTTTTTTEGERKSGLEASSALDEVNDQDDDGNYEQEVDQTAANMADEAKKPENDQDDNYSPKHRYSFRLS
jgi:hypothetical protein